LIQQNRAKSPFLAHIGPILFLTCIFWLNFLSRIILAPLLPTIETDLGITHGEAGSLFMIISIGYSMALLGSGFISSKLSHRTTIIISSVMTGLTLLGISFAHSLFEIRIGLLGLGMAAGLYLPSGMTTITAIIEYKHWGKAIAIHELAPSLAFITAPLISESLMQCCPWKGVLILIGGMSILAGISFSLFGSGGTFTGNTPNYGNISKLLGRRPFWIMTVLFSLGIACSIGIYSMLPLYLVSERYIDRSFANTVIGLSRIPVLFVAIVAGWISDRIGPKATIRCVLIFNGIMTMLLGITPGNFIVMIIFLQPMLSVCFFPAAFTILSSISPPEQRSLTVSLTVFVAYLMGAGIIPAAMGILGETVTFSISFVIVGGLIGISFVLTRFISSITDDHSCGK
jgi:NNP family nitrate/nitrite transporter-like MFS transporter